MKASPHIYREIKKRCSDAVSRSEQYLRGETPDGKTVPILFFDEIEELMRDINRECGRCELGIEMLETARLKSKYQEMIRELDVILYKLQKFHRG